MRFISFGSSNRINYVYRSYSFITRNLKDRKGGKFQYYQFVKRVKGKKTCGRNQKKIPCGRLKNMYVFL